MGGDEDHPLFPPRIRAAGVLVGCLAASVSYALYLHHGDAAGHFHGEPIGSWLAWKLAVLWGWGALLSAACVSAGYLVVRRCLDVARLPTLETLVLAAAAGLVVFVLGMYAGGSLHLFRAPFAVLLPSGMLAAGARPLLGFLVERRAAWASSPPAPRDAAGRAAEIAAAAFGAYGLLLVYLGSLTPLAINYDASWSHVPIAVDYARAGGIVPFFGDYTRNYPHLASLVYTWAFIVPSFGVLTEPPTRWMLAQHLEFFLFMWTLAGVAAAIAWMLEVPRVRGAWAAFFLFPAIHVYDKNLGGAADHTLAFFAAPLFLAVVRCGPSFSPRASALAGVYAAGALLTKYQAVYLLFGAGVVYAGAWAVAWRRAWSAAADATAAGGRPRFLRWMAGPAALAATMVAVSSPHFLKNACFYGNPFYPFLQDVIPSHPSAANAAYLFEWLFKDYRYRPHGHLLATFGEAIRLVFEWPFVAHYSFTRQVPDGGALFVLSVPLLMTIRRRGRLLVGYAAGFGALFAWAMIFRVDRHLQTFMPLLAASTGALLVRAWELGWMARAGLVALVGLEIMWGGDAPYYSGHDRLMASVDLIRSTFEGRAAERFDPFFALERGIGSRLREGDRVLLHTYRPNLGMGRDTMLDWAGQQALVSYESVHEPRALGALYASLGVTHVTWRPGHQRAPTKQEEVLFDDFAHFHRARVEHVQAGGGRMDLLALPAELPPALDHPYEVLALGLHGYADGLYRVEAMSTYEDVPDAEGTHERYASPDVPLPGGAGADVGRADAVCLGDGFPVPAPLQRAIDGSFDVAATYPGALTVLVRRAPRGAPAP